MQLMWKSGEISRIFLPLSLSAFSVNDLSAGNWITGKTMPFWISLWFAKKKTTEAERRKSFWATETIPRWMESIAEMAQLMFASFVTDY